MQEKAALKILVKFTTKQTSSRIIPATHAADNNKNGLKPVSRMCFRKARNNLVSVTGMKNMLKNLKSNSVITNTSDL